MDFPGVLSNCEGCHIAGAYAAVPASALLTTNESINAAYAAAIAGGTATPTLAGCSLGTRDATVCPSAATQFTAFDTDQVNTPFAGACLSCHDSSAAKAHMTQNGAAINVARSVAKTAVESCAVCHGSGSEWDVTTVHK
jgi:OmcA/MtrC family decaheme c-type cytochrome